MGRIQELATMDVGLGSRYWLIIVHLLHLLFDRIDRYIRPLMVKGFGRKDIACYYVANAEGAADDQQALLQAMLPLLYDARTISIAIGEMGHQLMEEAQFIDGVHAAVASNQAQIEIVHGPNVDLETRAVFQLAAQGKVTLYQATRYYRHHFVIIERMNGECHVLDERLHNETLWHRDGSGHARGLIAGSGRFYYLLRDSQARAQGLKQEFERRKRHARMSVEHPGLVAPQKILSWSAFASFVGRIPFKFLLQPLAVYRDTAFDVRIWWRVTWNRAPQVAPQATPRHSQTIPRPLPTKAQQWMAEELARLDAIAGVANGYGAQVRAAESDHGLMTPTRHSLRAYRDLQFMRNPETSIASLAISDDLFLDLIWHDLYQISGLEEQLASGAPIPFRYSLNDSAPNPTHEQRTYLLLAEAIAKWRGQQSE